MTVRELIEKLQALSEEQKGFPATFMTEDGPRILRNVDKWQMWDYDEPTDVILLE